MNCAHCGSENGYVCSTYDLGPKIRRKRKCRDCGRLYWTQEYGERNATRKPRRRIAVAGEFTLPKPTTPRCQRRRTRHK
jgi:hypothetical protein